MLKSLSCLVLLTSCEMCLAGEPVARPPLPTFTAPVAESAVMQPSTPATTAAQFPIGNYPPPPGHPGGVWYRPEAVVPPTNDGLHLRYPYYSYRRPWYPAGPASVNVTIVW